MRRTQRYVLPRQVTGVGAEVAIMRVDTEGHASPFGRMIALHGGGFWVDEADGLSEQHDGLPWFLDDMRPQGFIGRTFAHSHPELQLGGDPRQWGEDDVLRALARFGEDLPGNLIVGEAAFERFHTLPARALRAESPAEYPRLAMQAMQGTHPGSSAGGEQPSSAAPRPGAASSSSSPRQATPRPSSAYATCWSASIWRCRPWPKTACPRARGCSLMAAGPFSNRSASIAASPSRAAHRRRTATPDA